MKQFNQDITVKVSVDSIAQQLLEQMNPEFKHSALVVETLIGRMLTQDTSGLSMLYNSLNGYNQDINFEIGEKIALSDFSVYSYWGKNDKEEYIRSSKDVQWATIKNIDTYADNKIEIEYTVYDSLGNALTDTKWINHSKCSKIVKVRA